MRAIVVAHDLKLAMMHRDHADRPEAECKLRIMLRHASIVHANRSARSTPQSIDVPNTGTPIDREKRMRP